MSAWLRKIWHDPVWSKVIAAAILLSLGTIWGFWSKWDFSTSARVAGAAALIVLARVWAWLAAPLNIPRGIVLALIAIAVTIIVRACAILQRLASEHRRQIELVRASEGETADALRQAKADILEMQRIRAAELLRPRVIKPPEASLDNRAIQVLQQLYRWYPEGKSVKSLSMTVGESYPVTEQTLDTLATLSMTTFVQVAYGGESYWALTKKGRDYCLRKGLKR